MILIRDQYMIFNSFENMLNFQRYMIYKYFKCMKQISGSVKVTGNCSV